MPINIRKRHLLSSSYPFFIHTKPSQEKKRERNKNTKIPQKQKSQIKQERNRVERKENQKTLIMKKNCELCKLPARTFCESDQASLCWDCDSKVHAANFLVERHMRTLLCHACQSPTPWKASGARLGNALSLCDRCAGGRKLHAHANANAGASAEQQEESEGDNDNEEDTDYDSDSDEDVDGDEDGDNQVVPWSSTAAQPPPASSSSGSDESVTVSKCNDNHDEVVSKLVTTISLKRRRLDHDFQVINYYFLL